jgi:methionyl-tRNA formyltransferase
MNITILYSDPLHPIHAFLQDWAQSAPAQVTIVQDVADVGSGDILFLIACQQIVGTAVRERFSHVLVVHGSDLPKGRGWSPVAHELLAGKRDICISLLEAVGKVDAGAIWHKERIHFEGTEIHREIHAAVSRATLRLMDWAIANHATVSPQVQTGEATYYERRRPEDSRVQPDQSIAEIFDLLRIADPKRYPVHFEHRGRTYTLVMDAKSNR